MRCVVLLCALLSGARALGATEGPAEEQSNVTEPLTPLEELQPELPVLENTPLQDELTINGEDVFANASVTEAPEPNVQDSEKVVPVNPLIREDEGEVNLTSANEDKEAITLTQETEENDGELLSEEGGGLVGPLIQVNNEEVNSSLTQGEDDVVNPATFNQEYEPLEDEFYEEWVKSLTEGHEEMKPLSQEGDEGEFLPPLLSDAMDEEEEEEDRDLAMNFLKESEYYPQNLTNILSDEPDKEIVSVLNVGGEEKPEGSKYTLFVFEGYEKEAGEKASPDSKGEDDSNTWLIFEEEGGDEGAASKSWEDNGESWTFDEEDDSVPSLKDNVDGLMPQEEDAPNDDWVPPEADSPVIDDRIATNNLGFPISKSLNLENHMSSKEERLSFHFYAYLVATAVIVLVLYAVYHNNRKIINFVMEKRGVGGWRAGDSNYQALDNKV